MKRQRRIFWVALTVYAVWLTLALRHAIAHHKPLGSLLVISIVPPLVVVLLWWRSERLRSKKPFELNSSRKQAILPHASDQASDSVIYWSVMESSPELP